MATVTFSTAVTGPVELPLAQFDAGDYETMAEAGVFAAGKRVELVGGYVVEMSPSGSDHNAAIIQINELFAPLIPRFKISVQGTLKVDRRNVFDPDFMLMRPRPEGFRRSLPTPDDVALLIEVAGSSLRNDISFKLPIYAEHRILDYWIADLERDVLIVHRNPAGKEYADRQEFAPGMFVAPLAAPDFQIAVSGIFS
jgi:Uma2 family endonuclease